MKSNSYVECPICGTEVKKDGFIEAYKSPFNNQKYELYECPECELQWWEPLKMVPEFYENDVFNLYTSFHEGVRTKIGQNHKAFLKYFPEKIKGKLLDIGCGDGIFLRKVQKCGFEVWGIDFDKKSVEVIKKSLGVETVYPMSLEEFCEFAREKNVKFDVVTFFEVLEHQDRPRNFLEMVKSLLKDGGYIAGSVPNRERLFSEVDWKYFNGDYPPHHFLRFSKRALENALKIVGFSNVEVYKLDFPKEELPAYIEKKVLGSGIDRLKVILKGKALKNQKLANAVKIEDMDKINPSPYYRILKLLKGFRNKLLFPMTLAYSYKLKERGIYLYFQARLKDV